MTWKKREVIIIALAAVTGLLAVISYFLFDERIVSCIVRDGAEWHRFKPVRAFALLGKTWLQIWLLLVWFCAVGRVRPVLVALGTIAIIAIIVPLLKLAVHRERPIETSRAVGLDDSSRQEKNWYSVASFPSGDTATVCGGAAAIGFFVTWPWEAVLLAAGAGVGSLRIAALSHHLSDVLAGAAIGLLCAWLLWRTTRRWPLPELLPLPACRRIATAGLIVIPLSILFSHNTQRSMLFLVGYVVPAVGWYLLRRAILHRAHVGKNATDVERT
jgi:membrane-associated phospholipid phosphatase